MTPTSISKYSNQRPISRVELPVAKPLSMISLKAIGTADVAAAATSKAKAAQAMCPRYLDANDQIIRRLLIDFPRGRFGALAMGAD